MDGKQLKQFIKLSESKLLDRYLSSRGISYDNLTPIQKISFSKSSSFLNWVKTNGARQDVFKEEQIDEIVYEANIQPTSAKSRSHIGNLSNPVTNSVVHPSSGKEIGLITKQPNGEYHAHHSAAKMSHSQSSTFDNKDKAHQFIRNAHAKAIKSGTLSDRFLKKQPLAQFAKEEVEDLGEKYTAKELKMAGGIAKDKRYAGGNMTGASKVMDKIRAGLSQTKQAQKALRQANEESEQIDELNKDTLYSYAKKSEKDQGDQFDKISKGIRDKDPKSANKAGHKFSMRSIGQNRAEKRLSSESLEIPELQLSELTSNLLARYKTRASASAKAADQAGNYKKGDKRFKGILKATTKQFDNDLKKQSVKEELYDSEKEDKSVATYGKKPKFKTVDPKDSFGDNKPQAAAILTGGKTLTGTIRDTIEIDPVMRRKPHNGSEKINKK